MARELPDLEPINPRWTACWCRLPAWPIPGTWSLSPCSAWVHGASGLSAGWPSTGERKAPENGRWRGNGQPLQHQKNWVGSPLMRVVQRSRGAQPQEQALRSEVDNALCSAARSALTPQPAPLAVLASLVPLPGRIVGAVRALWALCRGWPGPAPWRPLPGCASNPGWRFPAGFSHAAEPGPKGGSSSSETRQPSPIGRF